MELLSLVSDRELYNTDKYDLGYIHTFYDELFSPLKDKVTDVLEIGIHAGTSILLWRDFFNNATIYGIDVEKCDRVHQQHNIIDIYGDAYNTEIFSNFNNKEFDIIIDDGPHTLETMTFFINYYLPLLKSGGILIIEDIIDCAWTQILLDMIDPLIGKITKIDMRDKQKTQWHLDKWKNGLDVIIVQKY